MDEKKSKFKQTKLELSLRVAVGAYIIYLGGSLFQNLGNYEGMKQIAFATCALFFAVAGVALTAVAGYKWYKGAYVGGKLDDEYVEDMNQ